MNRLTGAAVWLTLLIATPAMARVQFPPLTGRVVDNAHVLRPQTQAALTAELAELERKTTDQVVVVTVPSLDGVPVETYGTQLANAWGVGRKERNTGVVFLIAPSEHRVRIAVGLGLTKALPDSGCAQILQQAVIPKVRAGDLPGGVVGGTEAIIHQLSSTKAGS